MRRRSYLAIVLSVLMLFFTACGKSNYSSYTIGGSAKSDSVFGSGSDSSGEDQTGSGSMSYWHVSLPVGWITLRFVTSRQSSLMRSESEPLPASAVICPQ